jgi:hypothetical protein
MDLKPLVVILFLLKTSYYNFEHLIKIYVSLTINSSLILRLDKSKMVYY